MGRIALALLVMVAARTADACSFPALSSHTVNAAVQPTDHQAPILSAETNVRVERSAEGKTGCAFNGSSGNSCGDLGSILITVVASDDQTPPVELGYRLRVTSGAPPQGVTIPLEDVRAFAGGQLPLRWIDLDRDSPFSFTLSITPIDAAGNLGTTLPLHIGDAGSGGCAIAPSLHSSLPSATALAFALLALRRRRR